MNEESEQTMTTSPMVYAMPVYKAIAHTFEARANCIKSQNTEWQGKHEDKILDIVKECLPSGSGFDNGTTFDFDKSLPHRLVFNVSFHHMNDNGMYDGWTQHAVIVHPSLAHDFKLDVTGRDRNEIKSYIHEVFSSALAEILPAPVKENAI